MAGTWLGWLARGVGLLALVTFGFATPAAAQPACAPTQLDAEGPFYRPNAPERERTGRGLVVEGRVRSAPDCAPLSAARLEWWSANPGGEYDDDHRAIQHVDGEGRYRYETDFPPRYGFRRPHLHVRVSAPGHRPLVTQLYPRSGHTAIAFDFVLVRE